MAYLAPAATSHARAWIAVPLRPTVIAVVATSLDAERTVRMGCWGLLVNGSIGHVWYMLLDRIVRAAGVRGVVTKVFLDQAVVTPPLLMAFFAWNTF